VRLLIALACGGVLLLAHAPIFADVPIDRDDDGDGFSNALETHVGTSVMSRCADQGAGQIDANPADLNQDSLFDILDISFLAQFYSFEAQSPGMYRYDIHPSPAGDGFVDIYDIIELTGRFGAACQ
jgi:hypothetical protein